MNVSILQFGYAEDNFSFVLSELYKLERRSLVVLPELWLLKTFSLPSKDNLLSQKPYFEEVKAKFFDVSVERELYISAGSLPIYNEKGDIYNANILFDGMNRRQYIYKKKNLFGTESQVFSKGSEPYKVNIEGFFVTGLVCFDLRFPEMFRSQKNIASDLFIVHAAWPSIRIDQWRNLLVSRAIENQAYVIGCNGVGIQGEISLGGNSMVISPRGEIIISMKSGKTSKSVTLDINNVTDFRREIPAIYQAAAGLI